MTSLRALTATLFTAMLLACSDNGSPQATPSATLTPALPTATTVPTPSAPPVNTTEPGGEVQRAIWLVDATSGALTTLLESENEAPFYEAGFDASGERVYAWSLEANMEIGFDLAGNEMSRGDAPELVPFCEDGEPVTIDGTTHSTPVCLETTAAAPYPSPGAPLQHYIYNVPSPDGLWYVYRRGTDLPTQTPASGPRYDLWSVNLETGERWQLYDGLYQCGGCDGDEETGWSASGRYYVHVERGPQRRVLLIDFVSRTVSDITWGGEYGTTLTAWSPVEDVLLRTAGPDAIAITDLAAGTERIVQGVTWSAAFDSTGGYIYADDTDHEALVVVAVATGDVLQRLIGERESTDGAPLSVTAKGVLAVMGWHRGQACEGTSVRLDDAEVACVEGGDWAAISPDGASVAVARQPGSTTPGLTRGGTYDVVLVDVASGTQTVVAEGAKGLYPPRLSWNAASTHLLIEWPVYRGL